MPVCHYIYSVCFENASFFPSSHFKNYLSVHCKPTDYVRLRFMFAGNNVQHLSSPLITDSALLPVCPEPDLRLSHPDSHTNTFSVNYLVSMKCRFIVAPIDTIFLFEHTFLMILQQSRMTCPKNYFSTQAGLSSAFDRWL